MPKQYFTLATTKIFMFQRALFLLTICLLGQISFSYAQNSAIYKGDTLWVNQKLQTLTLDQKLGQLFMVAAYSNKGEAHKNEVLNLVKQEEVGGLIFFQGTAEKQALLTNYYQQAAKTPLFIAMDAEWGLSMRLPDVFQYPWPLTVGAIDDTIWAYRYGEAIAKQCQRLGVNINFAPVVDINTNPNNPIINARSFGENPDRVTRLSSAFMRGMQNNGVMACAKHFPGHGDTDQDSHKTLPTVAHNLERLEEVELKPYRSLAQSGLGSAMVAHLNVPAMDATGISTSLSKPTIDFLKYNIGFDGLVFTDALNMKAVSNQYAPGEVDLKALLAGNDVLLFAQDVPIAKQKIKQALKDSSITLAEIDARVRKILLAKHWLGLNQKSFVEPTNIIQDLNTEKAAILNRQLFEQATTVLINKERTIPVRELGGKKIACITAGTEVGNTFVNTLKKYAQVDNLQYSAKSENDIIEALADYDLVIFGLYTSNASPWKSYKIANDVQSFIKRVSLQNKIIISLFANPYSLQDFKEAERANALVMAYQNHPDAESVAAQIIFGAIGAHGRLPVSGSSTFEVGYGLTTPAVGRMGFVYPGEVGLNAAELSKIDILVQEAIQKGATPGAQVLVARYGKVVYSKNFGYKTYQKKSPVEATDVYDLASITKIAATVPIFMKLVEEGKINLDKTVGDYLPQAKGTNKEDLVLRDILTHQARLQPWIPFYKETMEGTLHLPRFYNTKRSFDYPFTVVENLFSNRFIRDTILTKVLASDLRPIKEYKYSDLGYYLFLEIIEEQTGKPLDQNVYEQVYRSLGAYTMGFHPLQSFPSNRVIPTENDRAFRKTQIQGYVHDQGAALLGGVAGHAGLFSNANDLAKLMQMYMQKGEYAGIQYFDSVTVNEFTRCQHCDEDNRRGIGFDKPQLEGPGPTCGCVSSNSFGHSGFTGTLAWADPDEGIVYVFLSNRVYPDANNRKLLTLSTRTRIQKVIYDAIEAPAGTSALLSTVQP
jgi:beta-glucosidase-like glycosyl hydrolase/CubicO group peptidase (beta-lactamase class C family)